MNLNIVIFRNTIVTLLILFVIKLTWKQGFSQLSTIEIIIIIIIIVGLGNAIRELIYHQNIRNSVK